MFGLEALLCVLIQTSGRWNIFGWMYILKKFEIPKVINSLEHENLMLSVCMQCGTCSASCTSRQSFNLRKLILNLNLTGNDLSDSIWDCTTCLTCQTRCPRGIPLTEIIVDSRKEFVETGRIPSEIRDMLDSIYKHKNPFGEGKYKRKKFIEDIKKKFDVSDISEYYWFIGCVSSYESRSMEVVEKTARIFKDIGIDFSVDADEGCCGNEAMVLGEEGLFELLKEENEMFFKERGVEKVIASSPHCYNAFKKYYGLEVLTPVEVIYKAIKEGTLEFKYDVDARVTYHDPCYLGRYNGIYDAPREVIKSVYNVEFVEMQRIRENSYCCGGGSGNFLRESRANVQRVREALSTNADILVVSCPICLIMLEDAVKTLNSDLAVMDVVELVHLAMYGY
ncbi:Fe-S oxidoreductase [Archaeoglobus sulfaticallidus PM70-1]|uniref:Fe-S oxidoreductase n=2 Tax=Archaeoglobus TaxID=2233 RepID=N0BDV5_9EURY|nr:Fe-S oxidoreductase [Archaeoglobus sulfaticallidus PM70-1]